VRGRMAGRAGSEGGKWCNWWLYLQRARAQHSRSLKLCHIRRRDALLSLAAGVLHVCHPMCFSASHPPPVLLHTSARTQMLDANAPASSSTAESTCGRTPFGSSAISSSSLLQMSARSKTTQTRSSRRARSRGLCQCSEAEAAGLAQAAGSQQPGPASEQVLPVIAHAWLYRTEQMACAENKPGLLRSLRTLVSLQTLQLAGASPSRPRDGAGKAVGRGPAQGHRLHVSPWLAG